MERIYSGQDAGSEPARQLAAWAAAMQLTPREREVTELVIRGLRNKEVAAVLDCSELTVRNHLRSVFRKVDVTTRSELVFTAMSGPAPRQASA
jgi:DNA-binding CsgD family transcriptional regulator